MKVVIDLIAGETQLVAKFGKWLWGSETIWLVKKKEPGNDFAWGWVRESERERDSTRDIVRGKGMYNRGNTKGNHVSVCMCGCGEREQYLLSREEEEWMSKSAVREISGDGWGQWEMKKVKKDGVRIKSEKDEGDIVIERGGKWEEKCIWTKPSSIPKVLSHITDYYMKALEYYWK